MRIIKIGYFLPIVAIQKRKSFQGLILFQYIPQNLHISRFKHTAEQVAQKFEAYLF